MDYLHAFNKIMTEGKTVALATATVATPNVRMVNFFYNPPEDKGILYFSTFKGNNKIKEFTENNTIAFTTIPETGNNHIRVNGGTVEKAILLFMT
ncbi:pyridoxamine 5'-phosphate oxidase family protein [endosymbiont 'TC1' of Trimyema compressum]|uniref:pyridoxamine 5'-phosphate oxidase family protein n=1 Tax=endosymbiont 'TC1' of Trimyema compressum TaxID=243899 RepID=UPI00316AEAAB